MTSRWGVAMATLGCLLLVAASPSAKAAEGIVKVFEAHARDRPAEAAPVLQTFPENAELSVSEEVTGGWRRVRLANGGIAFMRDDELRLRTATTPPAAPAAAPGAPTPATPILYVKDLGHLAEIVGADQELQSRVRSLDTRRYAAIGVVGGGLVAATLLVIGAMTVYQQEDCLAPPPPPFPAEPPSCMKTMNSRMFLGGMGTFLVGLGIGALLLPSRDDVLDVINQWNGHHVDHPITLDHGLIIRN